MAFILVYGGEELTRPLLFYDSTKTALLSISWKYKFSAEICLMFEGRSITYIWFVARVIEAVFQCPGQ